MGDPFRVDLQAALTLLNRHPSNRSLLVSLDSGEAFRIQPNRTGKYQWPKGKAIESATITAAGGACTLPIRMVGKRWLSPCEDCHKRQGVLYWEPNELARCWNCSRHYYFGFGGPKKPLRRAISALRG